MSKLHQKIEMILRQWAGEDEESRTSPHDVAEAIDAELRHYLLSRPAATRVIWAGQRQIEKQAA